MTEDIDSAFESIIMSEERVVEQGFQEGLQVGNISGYEKGFAFGVKRGAQLNQELGFCNGFARTWLKLLDINGTEHRGSSNVKSVLHTLVQVTDNFPRNEPHNVNIQQQLAVVRAKFKQACSLLKISASLDSDSADGISF